MVHPSGSITFTRTDATADVLHRADQLFASMAESYGSRAVVIVLSGAGHDGSDGVCAVRRRCGTVIVQDEADAFQRSMPREAIATGCADFVLCSRDIAPCW